MVHNLLKLAIMLFITVLGGCSSSIDYVVHGERENNRFEVPGYILTDVPRSTEYGEIWVDSFTQPSSVDGVDILWVIDRSCSMDEYDPELLAGIEAMMNALPESGWRLAMMSSDPYASALEAQFPLVPGDDIGDAINMFSIMKFGAQEKGFDAVYEYITNNPYASTWMRQDAALLVVFVSDEEEQSNTNFYNVDDFKSWYGNQRGGSGYIASIINVNKADSVCTPSPVASNSGYRYMEVTNFFGGVIVDICDIDWASGVKDASSRLEPYEFIELTYFPSHESSMRVFVNGVPNWDWYYDRSNNTVYFTNIPESNDSVDVAYHYDPENPYGADTGDTGP